MSKLYHVFSFYFVCVFHICILTPNQKSTFIQNIFVFYFYYNFDILKQGSLIKHLEEFFKESLLK